MPVLQNFTSGELAGTNRGALAIDFPRYVEDVVLNADTQVAVPIPAGAQYVVFSFDGDFRAKIGAAGTTLTLPSATSNSGAGSELNPAVRRITTTIADGTTPATHVILRAPVASKGSLSFYA